MKTLVFVFLLFACLIKAQDSSYCYNSGKSSVGFSEEVPASDIQQERSLILMPVMNEKEVLLALKEKNDPEINGLLKSFKLSRTFKNIGFSAIPEALFGTGLLGAAAISNQGTIQQKGIGIGLLALSAVSLSSSLCFKIIRTKNYKKAIAKYNQLYN